MNISNEENFVYSLTVDQRKLYHYYKNAATEQLRRENDQLRQQVAKAKDALQVIAEKTLCLPPRKSHARQFPNSKEQMKSATPAGPCGNTTKRSNNWNNNKTYGKTNNTQH